MSEQEAFKAGRRSAFLEVATMCDREAARLLVRVPTSKPVSVEAGARGSHCEMLASWAREKAAG